MRVIQYVMLSAVLVGGALEPGKLAAQAPVPAGPDTVVFTPTRGKVTFVHSAHAKANECGSCHHESKAEKPLTSAKQKCDGCHTTEATAPMKTTRRMAYHDTENRQGTCMSCHAKAAEAGKQVPVACGDCHKRED